MECVAYNILLGTFLGEPKPHEECCSSYNEQSSRSLIEKGVPTYLCDMRHKRRREMDYR